MENSIKRSARILTQLLVIAEKGKVSYKNAATKIDDPALKHIFEKCSEQREEFTVQIKFQLQKLGNPQRESHCHLGNIRRKVAKEENFPESVKGRELVNACLSIEESNLRVFKAAFHSMAISPNIKLLMLDGQLLGIAQTIKHLRLQIAGKENTIN